MPPKWAGIGGIPWTPGGGIAPGIWAARDDKLEASELAFGEDEEFIPG